MSSSLRETLRVATADIHARLHLHTGFAAIQNGTIDLVDYRTLLARLYGFHLSFEVAVGMANDRSAWLKDDLAAVGIGSATLAIIPRCTALTEFATPGRRFGALYVIEGSTLGGRHLARHLDSLLGVDGSAGRRFFLGRGPDTNAAWNAFLAQMSSAQSATADRGEIVDAAVLTFGIFQEWLDGWRSFTV
jgi:heme oxygenase